MKIYADSVDITEYTGGLSWQNNLLEIATTMNLEVAKSNTKYINTYTPQAGSIISLYTNEEIFRGIVLTMDDGDSFINKYTVCDFGWYLNKSKETYQFNNWTASKVLQKICGDFNIPIDSIPNLDTKMSKIYFDKTISEIISDVLEICGGKYNYDITPKGLRVYKLGYIVAYPEFRVHPNMSNAYSGAYYGAKSHTLSIEDMKNSIKAISEKDNKYRIHTVKQDKESIKRYGLLQDVVKVDLDKENPEKIANAKLLELNTTKEDFSIEIIEDMDSYTRAGAVINIEDMPFLIENSSHGINNGIHYVKLDLKRFV